MFRKIAPADWSYIDRIQRQAYPPELQEQLSVLQRKAQLSPDTCFVYLDEAEQVSGYCLLHPCQPGIVPELDAHTDDSLLAQNHFFLHDMALARAAQGQGVAKAFVEYVVAAVTEKQAQSIALVAVQGSVPFWSKLGFNRVENSKALSYGSQARYMVLELL